MSNEQPNEKPDWSDPNSERTPGPRILMVGFRDMLPEAYESLVRFFDRLGATCELLAPSQFNYATTEEGARMVACDAIALGEHMDPELANDYRTQAQRLERPVLETLADAEKFVKKWKAEKEAEKEAAPKASGERKNIYPRGAASYRLQQFGILLDKLQDGDQVGMFYVRRGVLHKVHDHEPVNHRQFFSVLRDMLATPHAFNTSHDNWLSQVDPEARPVSIAAMQARVRHLMQGGKLEWEDVGGYVSMSNNSFGLIAMLLRLIDRPEALRMVPKEEPTP